jgi:hypothetical protein
MNKVELDTIARVLLAWIAFRNSHDLKDAQIACCDKTRELFDALQAFEDKVGAS